MTEALRNYAQLARLWPQSTALRKREWSLDEIELLRAYWLIDSVKDFASAFKRSPDAIYKQVQRLGLPRRFLPWTPEEEAQAEGPEPHKVLTHRTANSIYQHRQWRKRRCQGKS
jgi:hypothetical protein